MPLLINLTSSQSSLPADIYSVPHRAPPVNKTVSVCINLKTPYLSFLQSTRSAALCWTTAETSCRSRPLDRSASPCPPPPPSRPWSWAAAGHSLGNKRHKEDKVSARYRPTQMAHTYRKIQAKIATRKSEKVTKRIIGRPLPLSLLVRLSLYLYLSLGKRTHFLSQRAKADKWLSAVRRRGLYKSDDSGLGLVLSRGTQHL